MSKKVGVEIDLDIENNEYDIRFKKLSQDEDFEMDYWELRNVLEKIFHDLDRKIEGQGSEKTFSKFVVN